VAHHFADQRRWFLIGQAVVLGFIENPLWLSITKVIGEVCMRVIFNLQHALSCNKGGFIAQRHNTLRDVTARLITEVCKDVKVEPPLHPLTGENLQEKTANKSMEARLDISARGFWVAGQRAFFDIRVFNPIARRYSDMEIKKMYETNEKEKKRHSTTNACRS